MMILGEKFFYMHNMQEAKFDISEIKALLLQPSDIQVVDVDMQEIVSTETVYVVIAVIDEETFAATKPMSSETKADTIARIIQKKLHRLYGQDSGHEFLDLN